MERKTLCSLNASLTKIKQKDFIHTVYLHLCKTPGDERFIHSRPTSTPIAHAHRKPAVLGHNPISDAVVKDLIPIPCPHRFW